MLPVPRLAGWTYITDGHAMFTNSTTVRNAFDLRMSQSWHGFAGFCRDKCMRERRIRDNNALLCFTCCTLSYHNIVCQDDVKFVGVQSRPSLSAALQRVRASSTL